MHSPRTLAGALVFTFACISFVACNPVAPVPTRETGQNSVDMCGAPWVPTGSLAQERWLGTAVRLGNGSVLVAGGFGSSDFVAGAERYDAASETWSAAGTLNVPRYFHRAVGLQDGRVMVIGGFTSSGITATAEIYDPATNAWTLTPSMSTDRTAAQAVLLSDGRVLVAGGQGGGLPALASAEIYNPATNAWTSVGSMGSPRYLAAAAPLGDGRVLVAGGNNGSGQYLSSAEIFNPATNTWSAAASMAASRYAGGAAVLAGGKVLMAGGTTVLGAVSAESFDPATNTWTPTQSMVHTTRSFFETVRLPDGRVLVAGGTDDMGVTAAAEILDPETGEWSPVTDMSIPRYLAATAVLPDGRILIAGGANDNGFTNTAETYRPCPACGGPWNPTGNLNDGHLFAAAVRLTNGKVLVTGGLGSNFSPSTGAELYDPGTGTWSSTGSMSVARYGHQAVRLKDGRVLVAGGQNSSGLVDSVEIYDPNAGSWSTKASMHSSRFNFQLTLLLNTGSAWDGRVLASGGVGGGATAEVYNAGGDSWTLTGAMTAGRSLAAAVRLDDGKVLVAGGDIDPSGATTATTSAEIYDPANNNWTATARQMLTARYSFGMAVLPNGGGVLVVGGADSGPGAEIFNPSTGSSPTSNNVAEPSRRDFMTVQLADGRVLVAGGNGGNSAEIYDPDLRTWSQLPGMTSARTFAVAAELDNRRVLVAGGLESSGTSEIFKVCPPNRRPVAVCRQDVIGTDAAGRPILGVIVPTSATTCTAPGVRTSDGRPVIDNGSYDPDNGPAPLAFLPPIASSYNLGYTPASITVSDSILTDTCSAVVKVVDQTKPRITCPSQQFLECDNGGAVGTFTATATDNCGVRTVSCAPSGTTLPLGNTTVNCSATDNSGNVDTCSFTATVQDTLPPVTGTSKNILLWPPDGALHEITLMDCANFTNDRCFGRLNPLKDYGVITAITSDEPENAAGGSDGNTTGDMQIKKPWLALIRAERDTSLNGRVYTLYYTAKDNAPPGSPGVHESSGSCQVFVPRNSGGTAVDNGPAAGYCFDNPLVPGNACP